MMGVIDETGKLEYGQVFFQYTERLGEKNPHTIYTGKVIVTKNPCLFVGDIKKLDAVDVPELHHLWDVIVFPAKGPRPHTDEISGSDLDGDRYFVCWDQDLIPTMMEKPMDYDPPETKKSESITIDDVKRFFIDYIRNEQLGIIDNQWLVYADEEGVHNYFCKYLSVKHAIAVDFPKHGVVVELPKEIKKSKYPDFMERPPNISYYSRSVVGKLWRIVVKSMNIEKDPESNYQNISPDNTLLLEEYFNLNNCYENGIIEEILNFKFAYDDEVNFLKSEYGIESEAELLLGDIIDFHSYVKKT